MFADDIVLCSEDGSCRRGPGEMEIRSVTNLAKRSRKRLSSSRLNY